MKKQLGGLVFIDVRKTAWNFSLERILQRFGPAGLLFKRLIPTTADVYAKLAEAQNPAPFLAIEEEGGGGLTDLFDPLPPLNHLDTEGAAQLGELIGRAMALLGLHLNLAPTLDLAAAPAPGPGDQSRRKEPLSTLPAEIASRAHSFVDGLERHRVLACGRHFPGMPQSSSTGTSPAPVVNQSMATLWREDLAPYRALGAKLAMVQVTHAVHKAYDYEFPRPASLSPAVVEGLLRVKLGYKGIALADGSAAAQAAGLSIGEAAVKAVAAGCDLVLVPGDERRLTAVLDSLQGAVDVGTLATGRVEQALERIVSLRKRLPKRRDASERGLARVRCDFAEFNKKFLTGVHRRG